MGRNHRKNHPQQPPAGPDENAAPGVPETVRNFIKSVAPEKDAPLTELQERFSEARRHDRSLHPALPNNYAHGSVEYMVELRIREWMRRKEAEEAQARRLQDAASKKADSDAQNTPKIRGNNISPPKP